MASHAVTRLRRVALALLGGAALAASFAPGAASASPTSQDIQAQIEAKGRQLDAVVEQYNGLNLQLSKTTTQAQAAAARLGPLQAQQDAASAVVEKLAVQAYEGGSITGISSLIQAGSPEKFLDQLTMLRTLSSSQRASITSLVAASSAAQAEKSKLDQLLAAQSKQKTTLAAQKTRIQSEISALERQKAALHITSTSAGSYTGTPPPVSGRAGIAVRFAYAQLGKPYVFGASGPNSYDCSGLTMAAWAAAGVRLSHFTGAQLNEARPISRSQLAPGDLVFFYSGGHVGIYIGNGSVIHAPHPGDHVKISTIAYMGSYYAARRPG